MRVATCRSKPWLLLLLAGALACSRESGDASRRKAAESSPEAVPREGPQGESLDASPANRVSSSAVADAGPKQEASPKASPAPSFAAWLKGKLPAGGKVDENPVRVVHKVASGDTHASIAQAYLDLTDVYLAEDLAALLQKRGPLSEGAEVEIPSLLREPYKEPAEDRLGWPADGVLRGVFLTGLMAGRQYVPTLDKLAERGLNAVVLDGKDYMGPVNYASKAKIALETGATKNILIPNLPRTIRFAHARGVRVIMRIPCFHDPWAQKRAPRLSVMGNWGKPFPLSWLDPVNEEAQDYAVELAREMADAGADEIQLDYVRFPVQGPVKSAVLPPAKDGIRSRVIRDFVKKVADVVKPKGVKLSLDIFGVASTGQQEDIEALGQEIGIMSVDADAISPMVYPSHYDAGFYGFKDPANHPEIIGIGTKAAVEKLRKAGNKTTVVRSWLQAFSWRTSAYGPKYVADEIKHAEATGTGWLLWDPGCTYGAAWAGIPKLSAAALAANAVKSPDMKGPDMKSSDITKK